jgi:hypothetical protein
VPLSEHEQRLLDQIERALYAEDPKFATTVRSTDLRTHMRRRVRRSVALFGVGFILLLVGVTSPVVGIIGFVVMLGALVLGLTAWKRLNGGGASLRAVDSKVQRPAARKSRAQASPKQRIEERWRRRWEERGGPQ